MSGFELEKTPLPKNGDEIHEFVVNATKLYRESWIIPIVKELIEEEKSVVKKRRERKSKIAPTPAGR
jgi:hypothetical protein